MFGETEVSSAEKQLIKG